MCVCCRQQLRVVETAGNRSLFGTMAHPRLLLDVSPLCSRIRQLPSGCACVDSASPRRQENAAIPMTTVDTDVAAERQRITNTPIEQITTTDVVILRQLTKIYNSRLRYLINSEICLVVLTVINIFKAIQLVSVYKCDQLSRSFLRAKS